MYWKALRTRSTYTARSAPTAAAAKKEEQPEARLESTSSRRHRATEGSVARGSPAPVATRANADGSATSSTTRERLLLLDALERRDRVLQTQCSRACTLL